MTYLIPPPVGSFWSAASMGSGAVPGVDWIAGAVAAGMAIGFVAVVGRLMTERRRVRPAIADGAERTRDGADRATSPARAGRRGEHAGSERRAVARHAA